MEDYEIDEFEKLYALVAAKVNSEAEIKNYVDTQENFEKIMNLAEYKLKNSGKFNEKYKEPLEKDLNYYVLPILMKQKDKEINVDLITDSQGYGLFIVMENGLVAPTAELRDRLNNIFDEYIEEGVISKEETSKIFEVKDINDAMELIDGQDLTLEKVEEYIKGRMKELQIQVPEEEKEDELETEKDDDKKEETEKEESKKEKEEDKEYDRIILGISKRYGCKPEEVTYRKIDDLEMIEEKTGMNLRMYWGKVLAVNINRGYKEENYLVNSDDFKPFVNHRGNIEEPYIPEVRDIAVKYKIVKGENARSYRNDEGRSYITHLDAYGDKKEMKYIENGAPDDMSREDREKYITEVDKINEILQDAIDEYQRYNTKENWFKVRDAMIEKVKIDKKYKAFGNQKRETIKDLDETEDEVKKVPSAREEDDDWGPWSAHEHNER